MPMPQQYRPKRAWLAGLAWFAVCQWLGWQSGVVDVLIVEPWFTPEQLVDPYWLLATALVSGHVGFAYLYFWPRGTTHHGRPLHRGWATAFGLLWGITQSQLLLAAWYYLAGYHVARLWLVVAMLAIASAWAGTWHRQFWDRYVLPDHRIREWNRRKLLYAHAPFLLLSLLHLAVFDNPVLFVIWQTVALVASCWAMRFPAPGDPDTPPHDGRGVPMADGQAV